LIHPDKPYEDWKALGSLRNAAGQLKCCLSKLPLVCEHFGLAAGKFSVVPFLLTNIWDFTGSEIMGFKVVDFSYLSNLLTGAEIWEVQFKPEPTRRIKKLIKGKYPTGDELAALISNPIHRQMFRPSTLQEMQIPVGEWTLAVPVEIIDERVEKDREATIAKLGH
jgi:hypothetical protein